MGNLYCYVRDEQQVHGLIEKASNFYLYIYNNLFIYNNIFLFLSQSREKIYLDEALKNMSSNPGEMNYKTKTRCK